MTRAQERGWGSEDAAAEEAAELPPPWQPLVLQESEWADEPELALMRFQAAWRRRAPVVACGVRAEVRWDSSDLLKRVRAAVAGGAESAKALRSALEDYHRRAAPSAPPTAPPRPPFRLPLLPAAAAQRAAAAAAAGSL